MLEKIKDLILKNKLYTGIIAGTVALCIVAVAVCVPMMSGPQLPTSDPTSSGTSDLPEPTDPDEPSVPDSSDGDVTSGTDGTTSTTRGQSNSSTSAQPTSLSKTMNKIGNTIYKADSSKNGYDMNSLVGVDALGRTFSTMAKQNGKQVGMFFAGGFSGEYAAGNYDCTKILAMENGLKLLTDPKSYDPEISPVWQPHWWSEPIWGYYNQLDTWVVYRQLQMLAMANVDYICFDVTNTLNDWYADFTKSTNSFGVFMRAVIDLKKQGCDMPEVMFMTHSHSIETVKFLYKNLYKKGLYKDAWYYYNGKPLIAAVNGYALGGGCEIAMACDIRIAAENAVFGQPECGLGIIPGFGGTQRLARLVGKGRAKELIFTCGRIDAQEADRNGLSNKVVPQAELLDACRAMAKTIMSKGSYAVSVAKAVINAGLDMDLANGLKMEADAFGLTFATHDKQEGMSAFLEKRPAELTDF